MFYIKNDITNNYIKIVPLNIEEYLIENGADFMQCDQNRNMDAWLIVRIRNKVNKLQNM